MLQKAVRIAQPVFLVLAGLAIVLFLRGQWDVLRQYAWRILPVLLAMSTGLLLCTWAVEVEIWRRILSRVGGYLPYVPAVRIWFLSAILRYIPGNVWQPLSMTLYCMRYGIRPEVTVTSILLYQVIILLAAGPFVALYVWAGVAEGHVFGMLAANSPWFIAVVLAPVAAFVLRPNWLIGFLNVLLVRLGRVPMDVRLSSGSLLLLISAAAVNWVMWGMTFALFTFSIADIDTADPLQLVVTLIAAYPIAYAIGFLSFLTPSGFGVREGAFYVLLSPYMPGGVIAVAALAMRMWTTLGELLVAAVSAPFERTPEAAHQDRGCDVVPLNCAGDPEVSHTPT